MAAYNAAAHVAPALESLQRQTIADWELIVVDDGSSDDTQAEIARRMAGDPRLIFRRLDKNSGPAAARNAGLALARGAWIAILDSDDRFAPDRLEVLLARAERDGLDVLADNLQLYDQAEDAVICKAFAFAGESRALSPHGLTRNDGPPRIASLGHLKPFVRRSFLVETGVAYPVESRIGEDFCFLFRLLEKTGRALLIDYAGYVYTLPFSAASGQRSTSTRTHHGSDGLDELRRANGGLYDHVARQSPADRRLLTLLRKRGNRLRDEGAWRSARDHVKAREFIAAARILAGIDVSFGWEQLARLALRRKRQFQTVLR